MKIYIETLGCKVNSYESAAMLKNFEAVGYTATNKLAEADLVMLNSCTVTENSDRKARSFTAKVRREAPNAVYLICGCFPQAFPERAKALGADVTMGNGNRLNAAQNVNRFIASGKRIVDIINLKKSSYEPLYADTLAEHTRAFLKIEDGCERYCSYCAIPFSRGPVRSMPLDEVRRQAKAFADNGYKEIVLSGINLSAYGTDIGCDLGDAVLAAAEGENVVRIRLGSLECDILSDEVLNKFASCDKFCPQFHLSLQSGCSRTLRRMNRKYEADEYMAVVDRIRAIFDNPTFTTDIIVGFPGETEEDFEESVNFCTSVGFLRAHIFPYSKRGGTIAAALPEQVTRADKQARAKVMTAATAERSAEIMQGFVGSCARVILEQQEPDGSFSGYTDRYLPARVYGENLSNNTVVSGTISCIKDANAVIMAE